MTLRRLSAQNLRNITSLDIELDSQLNIFYGDNGSGKTTLLEAVSILSLGRSFRSRKYKTIINHDSESYTVFGQVDDAQDSALIPIGVQRDRKGQVQIKRSGIACATAAELAESLPVRILNGHSFGLLEGAPLVRRQFLDWLVFHVEPDFYETWRSYEKCLKHRNSLLRRDKIEASQLALWDRELAPLAARLDDYRQSTYKLIKPVFDRLLSGFEGLENVGVRYYAGWDNEKPFLDLLTDTQERDSDLGYTRQGPHRADLRINYGGSPAVDILSRGQQKIVVSALMIAQGIIFSEITNRTCVYLIDDLPAELDDSFRKTLAGWLSDMNCQVCVTGVEKQVLMDAWSNDSLSTRVFHVKHGTITQE
ncbi:MAG: DNA replication/repair protein RecF [Cellvibrionaceae bacterium]